MPLYAEEIKKVTTLKKYAEKGDEMWAEFVKEVSDRVKDIQKKVYGHKCDHGTPEAYFKEYIKGSDTLQFYYIQEFFKPIGFVVLDVDKVAQTVYIVEFFIRPKNRRSGKGKKIMKQLHDVTKKNNFKLTSVGVPNFSAGGKAFAKAMGFETVGSIMAKVLR